ncbi:MAG TPA: hypothetical protein VF164_07880, partial [Trueperaceae bacterium]
MSVRAASGSARDRADVDAVRLRRDLAIRRLGRVLLWASPFVVYFVLWVPIVVLVAFSFNDGASVSVWSGFTTRWYENILQGTITAGTEAARFQTGLLLNAVRNSVFVGVVSTLVATALGTMLALALGRGRFPGRQTLNALFYLPVVIPDITQGVSLAIFFNLVFETQRDRIRAALAPRIASDPGGYE